MNIILFRLIIANHMYCYLKVQNHDLNKKAKGAKCEDSYTLQVIYRSSQLPMSIEN